MTTRQGVHALIGILSIIALAAFAYSGVSNLSIAETVLYAALLFHSYIAVRFFAPITPATITQKWLNTALILLYAALALSIGSATLFSYFAVALALFVVAKRVQLIGQTPHDSLMRRVAIVDIAFASLATLALGGTLAGFHIVSAWALTITFVLMTAYVLRVKPLYVIDQS